MKRQRYDAEFGAEAALESLREDRPLAGLSSAEGVHSAMSDRRRRQLLQGAPGLFGEFRQNDGRERRVLRRRLPADRLTQR